MFPRTIQSKKSSKYRVPWITRELLHKMRIIDLTNKIAVSSDDYAVWEKFKRARNQLNIFVISWKLADGIRAKYAILLTSYVHVTAVSRPIFEKSKLIIEQ